MNFKPPQLSVQTERLNIAAYAVNNSSDDSHCSIYLIASDGKNCLLGGQAVFLRSDHPCAGRLMQLLMEMDGEVALEFRYAVWTRYHMGGEQVTLEIQNVWPG